MKWLVYSGIFVAVTLVVLALFYKTHEQPQNTATFAGVSLRLDYATTSEAQERGLGGRSSVPEGYGMLFVFPEPGYYGIWMRDMQAPIDVFWLDDQRRVVFMVLGMATSTYPVVFYPAVPARYVLETAAGFGAAHAVATGTPLILGESMF